MRKILIVFALVVVAGCQKTENPAGPTVVIDSKINVRVDPRMELLAAIQHYTGWATIRHTKLDFQYKRDVDNYFRNYATHPAVMKSGQLSNNGFAYDAPPAFILYHTNPPELLQTTPYSSYLGGRAGSMATLQDFASAIRDFAVQSNFMDFYNSHLSLYQEIEAEIKTATGAADYIGILESYYGEQKHSYNIIPTPLFHTGGYGPLIETAAGVDVYDICGPVSVVNGRPYFGNTDYFAYILLHEFSHSFVNPITSKHSSELSASASLYEPVRSIMTQQAYTNWEYCVNEHLVRVNVARFALLGGQSYHDQIIQNELSQGFIYITSLDTLMERYEKNRATYPTYESFYPEIIKHFNALAMIK